MIVVPHVVIVHSKERTQGKWLCRISPAPSQKMLEAVPTACGSMVSTIKTWKFKIFHSLETVAVKWGIAYFCRLKKVSYGMIPKIDRT